ncbi:MAG: hypothetical protein ACE5GB_12635, partial [Acidimicrobiales bacterium]
MATTIIAAAPTVVAEIPRRPSQYLRSLALSGVAAAAALAALVTLVLAASLGATQLFLLAALAAWVAATFGRGAVMAVRTAAGGSLVAGPSGVWVAGRPIQGRRGPSDTTT